MKYEAIVIGVSAGGMEALRLILPQLPADFAASVIVVQHVHPNSDDYLSRYLNERCALTVKEADEKEYVMPGEIYIAPPQCQVIILDTTIVMKVDLFDVLT